MSSRAQVLIVDDDKEINDLLSKYLMPYGFDAHVACDHTSMRSQLAQNTIDLIVMDVMLPVMDGLSLTREVRQHSKVPIIMLTARSDPYDRILGLENGADDYVTKPFEPRELVARIQSVLRRATLRKVPDVPVAGEFVSLNGWRVNAENRCLNGPDGMMVALSNAEFRLLNIFLSSPRRLLSRHQLMEMAHGHMGNVCERSIDLLVSRLRQKLGRVPDGADLIRTIRGRGYLFEVPAERRYEA